jgi:hypothetical protein
LTHDDHKEIAADMLKETKDLTPFTFGFVGEYIQTENKDLETILFTLVWLSTFGYSYFKGGFADRGRYESLVCPFTVFLQLIATKLGELDFPLIAAKLLENRDKVIQFLKDHKWTESDMTFQEWTTSGFWNMYGNVKDKRIRNSKGIKINKWGRVTIGQFNDRGFCTKSKISISVDEF